MIEEASFLLTKLKNYALFLLRKKSWTKEEFRLRLFTYLLRRRKELTAENKEWVEAITEEMTERGFLNDKEFARRYISHSLSFRKKGTVAIRRELKRKGIPDEMVDELLTPRKEEEIDLAEALIKKYLAHYEALAKRKGMDKEMRENFIKGKLKGLLARRGFSRATIKKVFG